MNDQPLANIDPLTLPALSPDSPALVVIRHTHLVAHHAIYRHFSGLADGATPAPLRVLRPDDERAQGGFALAMFGCAEDATVSFEYLGVRDMPAGRFHLVEGSFEGQKHIVAGWPAEAAPQED